MAEDIITALQDLGLSSELVDLLASILVVLKIQQLNIELLWETYAAGKPPIAALRQMNESNRRLAESMEQVVSALLCRESTPRHTTGLATGTTGPKNMGNTT